MKITLIISVFALIFAASLNCYAAGKPKVEEINLLNVKDIQDATAMENVLIGYMTQKAKCLNEKRVPPSSCKSLSEFFHAREVYRNTANKHPEWLEKSLHWTTPRDHHLYFSSFKVSFQ